MNMKTENKKTLSPYAQDHEVLVNGPTPGTLTIEVTLSCEGFRDNDDFCIQIQRGTDYKLDIPTSDEIDVEDKIAQNFAAEHFDAAEIWEDLGLDDRIDIANPAELDEEGQRIFALCKHLECESDDLDVSRYDETLIENGNQEYLVLTEDEGDQRAEEYIRNSLGSFNVDFLASYMPEGIGPDELRALRGDRCEEVSPAFVALVGDNMDSLIEDAISSDGRGYFLNTYDGEENEVTVGETLYFIYRVN